MEAAGARTLQDESSTAPKGLSLVGEDREAVLLQWERKIEQSERQTKRFERESVEDELPARSRPVIEGAPSVDSRPDADASASRSARFQRPAESLTLPTPVIAIGERRTITITGQPTPARRRPTLAERHIAAQPDRIALWAFLLGLLLIAVAAGTAHA